MAKLQLTRLQWRVVLLGWVTYASFYLGRVNLATALPAIQTDLHFSPDQISALAGATLWTYALGQLVNGWLGNHVDTRRMVLIGIVGSTFLNLLFATSSSLPIMLILWLVNGFLQSMGWGPILRTLSATLEPTQRQRIAGAFGASYVVGNAVTWVLTALLLSVGQWRLTFVIPTLLMLAMGIVWYILSVPAAPMAESPVSIKLPMLKALSGELWHILITALVAGALLNGALLYAPTFVAQTLPLDQAALTAIIFPVFGLLGTAWLSAWILERVGGNALRSLVILLVLSAVTRLLALILPSSTLAAVILLAGMGITSYALTNILLTAIPLTTRSHFGTSVVAGLMDATHSIGGAIGSTMVGVLLAHGNWSLVFGMWTVLPLIALGIMVLAARYQTIHRINPKEDFA